MKLDSEQKRVLKAALPAFLAFPISSPFFYWLFGKLDSWTDALIPGSKIPKDNNDSTKE